MPSAAAQSWPHYCQSPLHTVVFFHCCVAQQVLTIMSSFTTATLQQSTETLQLQLPWSAAIANSPLLYNWRIWHCINLSRWISHLYNVYRQLALLQKQLPANSLMLKVSDLETALDWTSLKGSYLNTQRLCSTDYRDKAHSPLPLWSLRNTISNTSEVTTATMNIIGSIQGSWNPIGQFRESISNLS